MARLHPIFKLPHIFIILFFILVSAVTINFIIIEISLISGAITVGQSALAVLLSIQVVPFICAPFGHLPAEAMGLAVDPVSPILVLVGFADEGAIVSFLLVPNEIIAVVKNVD